MQRPCNRCAAPLGDHQVKCPACGAWNSEGAGGATQREPEPLTTYLRADGKAPTHERVLSGPWDDNFGGGVVVTGVTLIGAKNGAGKSTMAAQWASAIAAHRLTPAVFFPIEESAEELAMRAHRLKIQNLSELRPLPTLSRDEHLAYLRRLDAGEAPTFEGKRYTPSCFVLDSVSALCGDDRELQKHVSDMLKRIAVRYRAPFLVLCQLIKNEQFAGAEYIQHAVDTVLVMQLEAFDNLDLDAGEDPRYLVTTKNRFGAARVDTPLLMTPTGLVFDKKEAARRKAEAAKKAAKRKHKIKG